MDAAAGSRESSFINKGNLNKTKCKLYIESHPEYRLIYYIDCGGYVNGHGVISVPSMMLESDDGTQPGCYWFVETRQGSQQTILLTRNASLSSFDMMYPMKVMIY